MIVVSIKRELLESTLGMVVAFSRTNVIKVSKLRTLTGKLSFIAGVVPALRPFVNIFWAALSQASARDKNAKLVKPKRLQKRQRPVGTVWKSQIKHGLSCG